MDLIGRVIGRARRRSQAVPPLPVQLTAQGSRRPLPVPEGWSRERVFDLLSTISVGRASPREIEGYLLEDFERFLITWDLVKNFSGRALEIGANPYFTTVLLREFSQLEITLTNSFDPTTTGKGSQEVAYADSTDGTVRAHDLECHLLNVETTAFPFESACFDVVLFCEVIEHLLMDPVAALGEIRRVLRPGGTLVVSTPNVARLENVARLIAGANLYDPYSGHGPYGRHNREYTRHELVRLLQFTGFEVCQHFTVDVHPHHTAAFTDPASIAPVVGHRLDDLGQYIFCQCVKVGEAHDGRPIELYRSLTGGSLKSWDDQNPSQLESGRES